jgi:hypothetical protein
MGLLDFPDPVSILEGVKNANLERETASALISSLYSAWISFVWRSGSAKWADWSGEGQAMKDAATAMYLSLEPLQKKDFLSLTVPTDLLDADNLTKFQTQEKTK